MDNYLPMALFFIVCTFLAYRLGVMAGRSSAEHESLAGPPLVRAARPNRRDLTPETRAEIEEALAKGHKIKAIRILRQATGMGLKESKETIEAEWS